jgi:hypothetical protein
MPRSGLICFCVASAALTAYSPMSPS